MTDRSPPDLMTLLRDILQQQTAMVQVQAESVRLQRVLVERLLDISGPQQGPVDGAPIGTTTSACLTRSDSPTGTASSVASAPALPPETSEPAPIDAVCESSWSEHRHEKTESDLPFAPAPVDQKPVRPARYYQPRPSPAARSIAPEELELMRRLQEMREASDLILQFGPYKGSTLAQVAMSDPDYIRQLMKAAQRPEVRAAAGRLVQALDAAAEHKEKTRSTAHRGRPSR